MKRYWRVWLIVALTAIAGYYLYPTVKLYSMSSEERDSLQRTDPVRYADLQRGAINLGLDLQGGIYLVLEVDLSKLPPDEARDAVDRAQEVIRNRIDQFGVAEPIIQREGLNRIIVELPGLQDVERAKNLIGQTALLEFKFLEPAADRDRLINRLSSVEAATKDTTARKDTTAASEKGLFDESAKEETEATEAQTLASLLRRSPGRGDLMVSARDLPKVKAILADPRLKALVPQDVEFLFSSAAEPTGAPQASQYYDLYLVRSKAELTGNVLKDAQVTISQSVEYLGQPVVNFTTTDDGARRFSRLTGSHIGDRLAIVLDGAVYSAPTIQSKIPDGQGIITGSRTQEEAKDLAIVLRAGALPARVEIIEDRTVGPSLGRDSIAQGKAAIIISMVVISLFMLFYYRFAGVVADIAMVLNNVFMLAILASFDATLTLPGIAGIVLTMAIAVDANVLIYERIREELRAGKTARVGVDAGYSNAFSVIIDTHLTGLIASVVLYQFGTGPIRGFALTLGIGLLSSLFTAIFVTRTIFEFHLRRSASPTLNIGFLHLFTNLHIPFMAWRKVAAWGISAFLLVVGLVSVLTVGLKSSIDFASGTLLELHFDPAVSVADLRRHLEQVQVGGKMMNLGVSEIKQFGSPNDVMVRVSEGQTGTDVADGIKAAFKAGFPGSIKDEGDWVRRQEKVGPKIGQELAKNAVNAVLVSQLLILLYIAWRFRRIIWGTAAVLATFHDVLVTVGLMSLLRIEVSMGAIAALLTIVGYSMNDTIVVFDRIREILRGHRQESFIDILNLSINQTLTRTVITSGLTLLSVIVLMLWGGEVNRDFVTILLIGIVVGTYSSIFVASPILLVLERWADSRAQRRTQRA